MNPKTWVPLGVAIVLGLVAAVVARHSILRTRAAVEPPKVCSVVIAKVAIPPGQELTADQVGLAPIAAKTPPPDTFTNPSEVVGRVSTVPMVAGQSVLRPFLAPKGAPGGLQALVPPGMRAITVDLNESSGLAGLLSPGCHVDVVSTEISQENADKSVSRIIVQNVPVIAIGQRLSGPRPEGEKETALSRTATLLVSPHDAEALDLGATSARIRLILRGTGDMEETDDEGVMLAELRGSANGVGAPSVAQVFAPPPPPPVPATQPATQPAVAEEPPRRVVTVILGNEERRVTFREPKPEQNPGPTEITDDEQNKPE